MLIHANIRSKKKKNCFYHIDGLIKTTGKTTVENSIEEIIISALTKDSRQRASEIRNLLVEYGYDITEEEVELRITKLNDSGVIGGYTISLDLKQLPPRIVWCILLKFKISQALSIRLDSLEKYLREAPFVIMAAKTRGDLDFVTVLAFHSEKAADEGIKMLRNLFGDIIQSCQIYELSTIKVPPSNAFSYSSKEYEMFTKQWFSPVLSK